jgi:hypothetical protein
MINLGLQPCNARNCADPDPAGPLEPCLIEDSLGFNDEPPKPPRMNPGLFLLEFHVSV